MKEIVFTPFDKYFFELTERVLHAYKHHLIHGIHRIPPGFSKKEYRDIVSGAKPVDRKRIHGVTDYFRKSLSIITFTNPHELSLIRSVIEFDDFIRVCRHEIQHWNEAVRHGFIEPLVGVYFISKGSYIHSQFFHIPGYIPPDMTDLACRRAIADICLAPDDPSDSDKFIAEGFYGPSVHVSG